MIIICYSLFALFFTKSLQSLNIYSNKRFNEWTFVTAHNSNLNWEDSRVLPELANQNVGIDKQLSYGVRGFMFDIDWKVCSVLERIFNSCTCEGICMCHGRCDSMFKDGFDIKPFSYFLKKIVNFLNQNSGEIITVFLENYIQDSEKLRSIYESVDNLTDLLFEPFDWNVTDIGWPKIVDMLKANKRLLIIDDEKRGFHADFIPGIIRSRDFVLQNHYEWTKDRYEWSFLKHDNNSNSKTNATILMPKCFSLHNSFGRPLWNEKRPLNLTSREHEYQPMNGEKLFLFNNFYGIQISSIGIDPLTLKLVNDKEYIMKRVVERCNNGTNGIRPTHIALDFISKYDVQNILNLFNNQTVN
jgi:hypothetical protein